LNDALERLDVDLRDLQAGLIQDGRMNVEKSVVNVLTGYLK
jgi:hypothetical protein